ncbi:MAG: oligosaccharide flippase family protein [Bacteroidota bacterium]
MNREFLVNIFFLLGINLLIKPFYVFFIERDVQNVVGASDYGIYFTLLNLSLILQIVNDFGIRNFSSRYIAQHSQLLQKYFPDLLSLKIILSIFYALLTLLAAWYLGYLLQYTLLVLLIASSRIIISFIDFFRASIIGLAHYRSDSILSVLHRLILILLCAFFLWNPAWRTKFSIRDFALLELISLLITLLIAAFLLLPYLSKLRIRFHPQRLRVLLRQSYPYAIIVFLMMIYNRVDAIMIEQLLPNGKAQVGIYAAAYRLLDAAIMFSFLFANLLLPMFSRMLKAKESLQQLLQLSFELLLAASITGVLAVYFFRNPIMELLYLEADVYWGKILGTLIWSFIAVSTTHIIGTALLANGSLKALNGLFLVGIVLNIALNLLFIPEYEAYGAAITTTATQFFIVIGELALAIYILKIKLTNSFLKIGLFTLLLSLIAYLCQTYLSLMWMLQFGLILVAGIVLAFGLKLMDWKAMKILFMNRNSTSDD